MMSKSSTPGARKARDHSRTVVSRTSDPSSPDATGKRRRLSGKQADSKDSKVDFWSQDGSLESCFPGLSGAALIEQIFDTYGDPKEYVDFPWFRDGLETVVSDPCNRPLQQSTVAEYEQRIFASGLASDCSGLLGYF